MSLTEKQINWRSYFDNRQIREIEFACLYARDFHHGTDGHNAKMIIAQMADLLDMDEIPYQNKKQATAV